VITLGLQEHLCLVHQASECLGVHDPVRIPLVAGADVAFPGLFISGTALALIRKGCLGVQASVFESFQFFSDSHGVPAPFN
jgi:hypothetical protein